MANHHRLRNSAIHSVIHSTITGVALVTLAGCATSTAPLENEGAAIAKAQSAKALSGRFGRNPTSLRIEPSPPKAPPAVGVDTVFVPSYVVEPLAESRLSPSAQTLTASGVELKVVGRTGPLKAGNPNGRAPDSGEAGAIRDGVQGPVSGGPPQPLAPPSLDTSFGSVDFDSNVIEAGTVNIPPDPEAAAGPNHLVNVANVVIAFHDKTTGTNVFTDSLRDFFTALSPDTNTFDPKVVFDPFEGRFVVVTLEKENDGAGGNPEVSEIFLAVSDDANPLGTWCMTSITANTMIGGIDRWADYPGFAVDEEAVYVAANMFDFAGGSSVGVRLWVVDKGVSGGFYDCDTAVVSKLDPIVGGAFNLTQQPAQVHGTAPAGVGTFLVGYPLEDGALNEYVQVIRLDDPLGSPVFTVDFVNVGNIEDYVSFDDAPQSGSTDLIETNGRRALDAEWFDNSLWLTATIVPKAGDPDAGETTAHWWEIDTSVLGSPVLTDQGNILGDDFFPAGSEDDLWTFFPSVAVNGRNQVGFGYSGSASSIFAGSFYTGRNPGEAAGTTQDTAQLKAGEAAYCRTFGGDDNRWGDYSSAETDPVDGCFWFYNEHAIEEGTATDPGTCSGGADEEGRWGTHYGKMCPPSPCPADMFLADIDLTGFDTRTAASRITTGKDVVVKTGATVNFEAEDIIVLSNGFSVEDGADFEAELVAAACEVL